MGATDIEQVVGVVHAGAAVPLAVRQHPRFDEAVRASITTLIELYEHHPLLNAVVSERDRFVAATLALDLHFHAPQGLTAAALKVDCKTQGVSGPARTSALIALMRLGGYLSTRGPRLFPTAKFIELHRDRWRRFLSAAALVSPAADALSIRMNEDAAMAAYCGAQADAFRQGFRLLNAAPKLKPFAQAIAGLLILCDLALTAWPGRGADVAPLSTAVLARRFSISQERVEDVLHEAQGAGLLELGLGTVRIRPALHGALTDFFGVGLAFNSACSEHALRQLDVA